MIKINFPILDEPLVLSNATILTIEDVSVYSSLVKHFYQYDVDEHLKLFDDKQKSLKATELMLVYRYLRIRCQLSTYSKVDTW